MRTELPPRITYAAPPSHPGRRNGKPVSLRDLPPHIAARFRDAAAARYLRDPD